MDVEKIVKLKILKRGFTEKQLLDNRGLIGAVIDETVSIVKEKYENNCIAEKLHESYVVQEQIEDHICDLFEKHEPDIYNQQGFDFSISSDNYDNSIEIYFKISLPYPYEPCKEIRQGIYDLGFSKVYWNFIKDEKDGTYDEIRGYEPRHYRDPSKWIVTKYGYVDERFNKKEWENYFKL